MRPWAVPLLFARDDDRLLLTARPARARCVMSLPVRRLPSVSPAIDGVVVAESTFESSANYRSAVLRGRPQPA